jgi:hypothetical protein
MKTEPMGNGREFGGDVTLQEKYRGEAPRCNQGADLVEILFRARVGQNSSDVEGGVRFAREHEEGGGRDTCLVLRRATKQQEAVVGKELHELM